MYHFIIKVVWFGQSSTGRRTPCVTSSSNNVGALISALVTRYSSSPQYRNRNVRTSSQSLMISPGEVSSSLSSFLLNSRRSYLV
jgi:hypothetical protein